MLPPESAPQSLLVLAHSYPAELGKNTSYSEGLPVVFAAEKFGAPYTLPGLSYGRIMRYLALDI